MQLAVYVKVFSQDMDKLRNRYLVCMGNQKHIVCRDHQLPLIASSKRDNKCTYLHLPTDTICREKECIRCSELNFQVRICKQCYDTHAENEVNFLVQPP